MRNRFNVQRRLGCTPIPIKHGEIPINTRAYMAGLMEALPYIYTHRRGTVGSLIFSQKKYQQEAPRDEPVGYFCTGTGPAVSEHFQRRAALLGKR